MPNDPTSTDPKHAAERACARVAPTWPLDRFIAVNPFWSCTDKPLPRLAAQLSALSGARLLIPRAWYAQEWREGRLRAEHLREAIAESGSNATEDELTALFWITEPTQPRRPLAVDVMDARSRRDLEVSWRDFIVERVSRFCGGYFDDGQAQIGPVKKGGLYASWRESAKTDRGPALFMGLTQYHATAAALPMTADEMLRVACAELGVPDDQREDYFWALLLDINGWASWCAYLRWTARLEQRDDGNIYELLAVRLAWEWIILRAGGEELRAEWRQAMASWPLLDRAAHVARADDWILQRAAEIAWTSQVRAKLSEGFDVARTVIPAVQLAFCLDVRSEVLRRALDAKTEDVQTIGCAGFFGLPIEYAPLAAEGARPQLPALFAAKYRVTDTGVSKGLEAKRRSRLYAGQAWKAFKSTALSSFAFVDAMGLFFAVDVFGESFGRKSRRTAEHEHAGLLPSEDATRTPRLTSTIDGAPLSVGERCDLALGMLRAMGLTRSFARLVVLVGHGAASRNNPHAAGLDCGACCGQSGEVNARAAAGLLNDEEVRAALVSRGVDIPPTTKFIGGLHNTTTDEVTLFDEHAISSTHARDLADLRTILDRASRAARRERAPKLGLDELTDGALHAAVVERSLDWAQVR
ncbi:MAG TPA: putative inorganic carbon transporter subunit DabA, partial [Polyangiaceae bacterium]|nr:putative inorganic carbon transporter subunit DabA [Polyangiaceae bacterium]